ncbi:MAG: thermonuclease family protein [Patescibacteria group bacterium]|nr:thermonuclease family protein [Patescibacteria group bacterium]
MSRRRLVSILSFLMFLGVIAIWRITLDIPPNPVAPINTATSTAPIVMATTTARTNALVVRVVDGDTIDVKLDSEPEKEYKVRLLGVNTPETVDPRRPVQCFGHEASDFTKASLNGKRIWLAADSQADERDKYGRLLRNVYLDDGTDFNAKLVSQGYAYAYVSFPQDPARKAEIRRLETEAKTEKRGLWAPGACN